MRDLVKVQKALLSVSDKSGIEDIARFLASSGVEILSTGGTARALISAGISVGNISDLTGFPEILGGRVKSLHPAVFGPILFARDDKDHLEVMSRLGMAAIDLVIVNLYPFERVAAFGDYKECIENIDIGGPSMVRAAAKNHEHVAIAIDPVDYESLMAEMTANDGATGMSFRRKQARKAFALTSCYDAAISEWMSKGEGPEFPNSLALPMQLNKVLRYGENPHQSAALYSRNDRAGTIAAARQLRGRPPGFNNIADADAAFKLVSEFEPSKHAACAIIKHCNPCGAATSTSCREAFRKALDCDRLSAFGGVVAFNRSLDAETAALILEVFTEIVIAPDVEQSALDVFAARPDVRVFSTGGMFDASESELEFKHVAGGYLVQSSDSATLDDFDMKIVTDRAPSRGQMDDLLFAWKIAKHAKSNAVVLAGGGATLGIGAGHTSRVDAARAAAWKANHRLGNASHSEGVESLVAASDAFFPFADGIEVVAESGAAAIIQPGGSIRDAEVIDSANKRNLAMVFSGIRGFRH